MRARQRGLATLALVTGLFLLAVLAALLVLLVLTVLVILVLILVGHVWFLSSVHLGEERCALHLLQPNVQPHERVPAAPPLTSAPMWNIGQRRMFRSRRVKSGDS